VELYLHYPYVLIALSLISQMIRLHDVVQDFTVLRILCTVCITRTECHCFVFVCFIRAYQNDVVCCQYPYSYSGHHWFDFRPEAPGYLEVFRGFPQPFLGFLPS